MTVEVAAAGKLAFAVVTTRKPGGCLLAGIGRGLIVQFSELVDPADVLITTEG